MRSVVGLHASLIVTWSGLRRPRSAARALIEQCRQSGWSVGGTMQWWPVIPPITSLERGREKRTISTMRMAAGTVMLMSTSAREP